MHAGNRRDEARRRIETMNRPFLGNRSVPVPCREWGDAERIENKFDAGKVRRKTDSEPFNHGLFLRQKGEERLPPISLRQPGQDAAFSVTEIAFSYRGGLRQVP